MKKKTFVFVIIAALCLTACRSSSNTDTPIVTDEPEVTVTVAPTEEPETTVTPEPTATPEPTVAPSAGGIEKLRDAKVGDTVYFGSYEQDNKTSNGAEKIEWYVLDRKGDEVLLFSKYLLDIKAFNNDYVEHSTWEISTLRTWLNNDFYNSAFDSEEKEIIKLSKLTSNGNVFYKNVTGGNDTEDNIFVLSTDECRTYFNIDTSDDMGWKAADDRLIAEKTNYANEKGTGGNSWWTRTPGASCCNVTGGSYFSMYGSDCDIWEKIGVRPALWLDLNQ